MLKAHVKHAEIYPTLFIRHFQGPTKLDSPHLLARARAVLVGLVVSCQFLPVLRSLLHLCFGLSIIHDAQHCKMRLEAVDRRVYNSPYLTNGGLALAKGVPRRNAVLRKIRNS